MTNIGTPDYQRGVVSAQALLATVAAGVTFATVGVPPNAESIIVVARGAAAGVRTSCYGVESSTTYPGTLLLAGPGVSSSPTWVYDVSAAIDNQVSVGFAVAPTLQWYIYSDAGVHITADLSKLTNSQGIPYYIPSAPSTAGSDHPPNEMQFTSGTFAATGTLIPAPGAGLRTRLFGMYLSATGGAGSFVSLLDVSAGINRMVGVSPCSMTMGVPLTGIAMPTNGLLQCGLGAGVTGYAGAYYTTETV